MPRIRVHFNSQVQSLDARQTCTSLAGPVLQTNSGILLPRTPARQKETRALTKKGTRFMRRRLVQRRLFGDAPAGPSTAAWPARSTSRAGPETPAGSIAPA